MRAVFTSIVGGIAMLTATFAAVHTRASNNDHKVKCADGTVYILDGGKITDEVACAHHGGISKVSVIVGNAPVDVEMRLLPMPLPKQRIHVLR